MKYSLKIESRLKIFILTTVFFFLSMVAPFALYEVNTRHRSSSQEYANNLINLNTACSKAYTVEDIEASAAVSAALISLCFGIIYGLLLTTLDCFRNKFQESNGENLEINKLHHFLTGNWNFKDNACNVFKFILIYIVFIGVLLGGIGLGISSAIPNFYGEYIVQTIGYLLFGISMTSLIPLILVHFDIIHPE